MSWLGGKVRRFDGCADAVYPYYIYEINRHESVVYANEVNKRGRTCYLCAGAKAVPDTVDPVTDKLPAAIEVTESYAPRFIDKFFGRYAVLLDTPFARQTVKKDLVLAGTFTGQKEISSKTAVSVSGGNGYMLKGIVKADGHAAIGAYLHGLLVNEIVIRTDGTFSFMKQGKELARVTEDGISCGTSLNENARIGAVRIKGYDIYNTSDVTDEGCIRINYHGTEGGGTKYRDFAVHDGKACTTPVLKVIGRTATLQVGGLLSLQSTGRGIDIQNTAYTKDNARLTNLITWRDSAAALLATVGFDTADSFRFALRNALGDIVLAPLGAVDVLGTLKINGKSVSDTYVTVRAFTEAMGKKVDVVEGKQLSTEDFTTEYRKKAGGYHYRRTDGGRRRLCHIGNRRGGFENETLRRREPFRCHGQGCRPEEYRCLFQSGSRGGISGNLRRIEGAGAPDGGRDQRADGRGSRRTESKAAGGRQGYPRCRKERYRGAETAKTSNLSDLPDKGKARKNLEVYSTAEIDRMMDGKLGTDSAYEGIVFTPELRDKLLEIKTGSFAYIDEGGISHAQVEGYVMTSQVVRELKKKAERLMGGYNASEKDTIATNLNLYTKAGADARFAALENLFQDYIDFLTGQGKSPMEARQLLRNKLDVLSKDEIVKDYLRKDGKLSDLSLPTAEAKRQACRAIGAAYAEEYQPLLADTGWMHMENSGSGTDTQGLFIRQIGNIVSIQGYINTARRDGSKRGGIVAVIPNKIQPPRYSVRCSAADWNDDHKYNRGSSFTIYGGSRRIQLYERGMYNVNVELNFTYFV
ncbi:hypothetical protein NXX09_20395 [Bacteroides uniformis]|nr:hypothetical protein [Bacteroides uniformis]